MLIDWQAAHFKHPQNTYTQQIFVVLRSDFPMLLGGCHSTKHTMKRVSLDLIGISALERILSVDHTVIWK